MAWDIQALFRRHAKDITRSLCRRGLSEETAADIMQDTFVRVLTAVPSDGAAVQNPKAYLYRVSRNLSINHHRRERLVEMLNLDDEAFGEIADPAPRRKRSSMTVSFCVRRRRLWPSFRNGPVWRSNFTGWGRTRSPKSRRRSACRRPGSGF